MTIGWYLLIIVGRIDEIKFKSLVNQYIRGISGAYLLESDAYLLSCVV